MLLILSNKEISYQAFHQLNIPVLFLNKKLPRYDPTIFWQLYKICKKFKPDLIHSWGAIQSFYLLPTVIFQRILLINGQITDACPRNKISNLNKIINYINFSFSKVILSNSFAGLYSYNAPEHKAKVIYNGISLERFNALSEVLSVKKAFKIDTRYAVVMVASFSQNKDYDYFYEIAKMVTEMCENVTFIGVGSHDFPGTSYHRLRHQNKNCRIIFHDVIEDVESLINACDIGVLFSKNSVHGEGISNSIMEYMSLSKPVIANDSGGTREILRHNVNGILIQNHSDIEVRDIFIDLLNDQKRREYLGLQGRETIENNFLLDKMGNKFLDIYHYAIHSRII